MAESEAAMARHAAVLRELDLVRGDIKRLEGEIRELEGDCKKGYLPTAEWAVYRKAIWVLYSAAAAGVIGWFIKKSGLG